MMIATTYYTSLVSYYYRAEPVRVTLSQSHRYARFSTYAKPRDKPHTHNIKSPIDLAVMFTHRLVDLDRRNFIQIPIARPPASRGFLPRVL